jgi:hypothetical protein
MAFQSVACKRLALHIDKKWNLNRAGDRQSAPVMPMKTLGLPVRGENALVLFSAHFVLNADQANPQEHPSTKTLMCVAPTFVARDVRYEVLGNGKEITPTTTFTADCSNLP